MSFIMEQISSLLENTIARVMLQAGGPQGRAVAGCIQALLMDLTSLTVCSNQAETCDERGKAVRAISMAGWQQGHLHCHSFFCVALLPTLLDLRSENVPCRANCGQFLPAMSCPQAVLQQAD